MNEQPRKYPNHSRFRHAFNWLYFVLDDTDDDNDGQPDDEDYDDDGDGIPDTEDEDHADFDDENDEL